MGVNGRGLGRFSFRPKSPQKGWGHLKHDFRLTERLLPDSTMTYRDRSDGLVVESDRKKILHLNVRVIYATYKDIAFIHKEVFFFFSFSPRQCVAPIALMDEPPLPVSIPKIVSLSPTFILLPLLPFTLHGVSTALSMSVLTESGLLVMGCPSPVQ